LTIVDKMAITTLQRETIWQFVISVDEVYNWLVNHVVIQIADKFMFLLIIIRIFRKFF